MKRILTALSLIFLLTAACRAGSWEDDYSRLLAKYVTPSGVRYSEWHKNEADLAALKKVVTAIADETPSGGRDHELAFYLNAYNANILAGVLASYPIKSIRDIAPLFGFFTQERIKVSAKKMSFNHLEQDVIIKGYKEPRIHFALNCASASCPPLRPKAYSGDNLGAQLDSMTKPFLNENPKAVATSDGGKKAAISKIFDWNKDDFAPYGGPVGFINKYRKPPLPADVKVSYQEYDWSLNAAH